MQRSLCLPCTLKAAEAGRGGPVYTNVDAEELKERRGEKRRGGGREREREKNKKRHKKSGVVVEGEGHSPSPCRVTLVPGYL